jgi:hypothetical protein
MKQYVSHEEYKRLKGLNYTDKKIAKLLGVSAWWICTHKKELLEG